MKAFLTNGRVITFLGLSFVGLTIGFSIWIARFDLQILDRFGDPDQVRTVLAAMTDDQKSAHWWMTLLLDYLYPVAYGGFFAGVIWRFFGKFGGWLALLALAAGAADAIENTIQLFILSGAEDLIWLKGIITPIKYSTFLPAAALALIGLCIAVARRLRKPNVS